MYSFSHAVSVASMMVLLSKGRDSLSIDCMVSCSPALNRQEVQFSLGIGSCPRKKTQKLLRGDGTKQSGQTWVLHSTSPP